MNAFGRAGRHVHKAQFNEPFRDPDQRIWHKSRQLLLARLHHIKALDVFQRIFMVEDGRMCPSGPTSLVEPPAPAERMVCTSSIINTLYSPA